MKNADQEIQKTICDAIRKGIELGEIVPSQRLVQSEICASFGASTENVRWAVSELVREGLLEYLPHRGVQVRQVPIEEALQLSEARMVVEGLCAARAAERITDEEIKIMRGLAEEMQIRAKIGDSIGYSELVEKVSAQFVRIAKQSVAEELLLELRRRNSIYRFKLNARTDRAQVSLPSWLRIIDAICNRDSKAARVAVERLATNAQKTINTIEPMHGLFGMKKAYPLPDKDGSRRRRSLIQIEGDRTRGAKSVHTS